MARLADLIFDCRHAASLARFWEAVLDAYHVAPYDADELARLASLGIHDINDDPSVLLEPFPGAAGPRIWFLTVPEPKVAKNRMHIDISAADPTDELRRLVELGARQAAVQPSTDVIVMADPEGNEFCLIRTAVP